MGAEEVNIAPLLAIARLLYDGPWVAERTAALRATLATPEMLHPTTRAILQGGLDRRTVDAFDAFHLLAEARRFALQLFRRYDALLLPTAPNTPLLAELEADPIGPNSRLGTWTNFVNLCDLAAWAVPSGLGADGLPGGVTIVGPAWSEGRLAALADRLHRASTATIGSTPMTIPPPATPDGIGPDETALFCIGGHMAGLPLNGQLTERGGRFIAEARTQPQYRLFALGNRPGLLASAGGACDRRRDLGNPHRRDRCAVGRSAAPARLWHGDAGERSLPRFPGRGGGRRRRAGHHASRRLAGLSGSGRPGGRLHPGRRRAAELADRSGLAGRRGVQSTHHSRPSRDDRRVGYDRPGAGVQRMTWPTATSLAADIRAGRTTATAAVQDSLDRIARDDGVLNAFTDVVAERALARAATAPQGPLGGVPFAVKNLFDVAGLPTRAGSAINRSLPPAPADAPLIARMEAAGAILVGALNMGEYAYDFTGENVHDGPSRNPHDPTRMSGGSSGGSGAAVAGGLVPIALGSDTNGSIRVPSSLCGLFGLKPTYGRLSRHGTFPFVASLDHLGPLARCVTDLALCYDAMQGPSGDDPACTGRLEPTMPSLEEGIAGLRIAVAGGYFQRGAFPDVLAALHRVAAALGGHPRG